ncbi:DUF6461 domain-containing protein [Streptomyces mirabilis]|uniref:DUF6461 domain-containing protein n=1 Tax=Streptomyces mirabilis TaxID=68239 RepID=UPI00332B764E
MWGYEMQHSWPVACLRTQMFDLGLGASFEWPIDRYGSTPDELVALIREIGFDLTEDGTGPSTDAKAAVLALAERLTGVRLTEELLKDAEYPIGHVPEEPAEDGPSSSSTSPTLTGNGSTGKLPVRRSRPLRHVPAPQRRRRSSSSGPRRTLPDTHVDQVRSVTDAR